MSSVYVTREIPVAGLEILKRHFSTVEVNPLELPPGKDALISRTLDKEALLSLLTDKIDAAFMDNCPKLRVISNYAVGYDNIDVKAATARGIAVCNTPGVLTETTADLAFALMLAVARRVVEADEFMRGGNYRGWAPKMLLGFDLHGKTLGIFGMGRIGQAVARRALGFNMRILFTDQAELPQIAKECRARQVDFPELLKESDFLSLHASYTPQMHHIFSRQAFTEMKCTSILINTARGPLVDEEALIWALDNCQIAGAGLDVYENEPFAHKDLPRQRHVVLLPHIASATVETRNRMSVLAAENIVAVLEGRIPHSIINPEVLLSKG